MNPINNKQLVSPCQSFQFYHQLFATLPRFYVLVYISCREAIVRDGNDKSHLRSLTLSKFPWRGPYKSFPSRSSLLQQSLHTKKAINPRHVTFPKSQGGSRWKLEKWIMNSQCREVQQKTFSPKEKSSISSKPCSWTASNSKSSSSYTANDEISCCLGGKLFRVQIRVVLMTGINMKAVVSGSLCKGID